MLQLCMQLVSLKRNFVTNALSVLNLAIISHCLSVEQVKLLLKFVDAVVRRHLLMIKLLTQPQLLVQVVFELLSHIGTPIAVSLECAQLLNRLRSCHVNFSNVLFDCHVLFTLTIQIELHLMIHLISGIFAAQLILHHLDVLVCHAYFLHQIAPVTVDSIQLVQDHVQARLE